MNNHEVELIVLEVGERGCSEVENAEEGTEVSSNDSLASEIQVLEEEQWLEHWLILVVMDWQRLEIFKSHPGGQIIKQWLSHYGRPLVLTHVLDL